VLGYTTEFAVMPQKYKSQQVTPRYNFLKNSKPSSHVLQTYKILYRFVTTLIHYKDTMWGTVHCDIHNISGVVGFEVLTAVNMMMAVFWVVAPCSLVDVCRFRGPCCFLDDDGGSKDL
jgi:hypothetical protein